MELGFFTPSGVHGRVPPHLEVGVYPIGSEPARGYGAFNEKDISGQHRIENTKPSKRGELTCYTQLQLS
jgi:hypothetical protein